MTYDPKFCWGRALRGTPKRNHTLEWAIRYAMISSGGQVNALDDFELWLSARVADVPEAEPHAAYWTKVQNIREIYRLIGPCKAIQT